MKRWSLPAAVLLTALVIAGVVSHWASPAPDGLEHVAERLGFADAESTPPGPPAVMPDYNLAGAEGSPWGRTLAGVLGVLVVLATCLGLGYLLRRRRAPPPG